MESSNTAHVVRGASRGAVRCRASASTSTSPLTRKTSWAMPFSVSMSAASIDTPWSANQRHDRGEQPEPVGGGEPHHRTAVALARARHRRRAGRHERKVDGPRPPSRAARSPIATHRCSSNAVSERTVTAWSARCSFGHVIADADDDRHALAGERRRRVGEETGAVLGDDGQPERVRERRDLAGDGADLTRAERRVAQREVAGEHRRRLAQHPQRGESRQQPRRHLARERRPAEQLLELRHVRRRGADAVLGALDVDHVRRAPRRTRRGRRAATSGRRARPGRRCRTSSRTCRTPSSG